MTIVRSVLALFAVVGFGPVGFTQFANPGAYTSPDGASSTAGPNVLFFGNSFTISSENPAVNTPTYGGARGIPELYRQVAIAAGGPAPFVKNVYHLNRGLDYHVQPTNPSLSEIDEPLLEGEAWDFVVLQGFSLRPTDHPYTGNRAKLALNAERLLGEVRTGTTGHLLQSPNVTAVLFQTWARPRGHWLYDPSSPVTAGHNIAIGLASWTLGPVFSGPEEMAGQVRSGYQAARSHLDATVSAFPTRIARCGDVWAALGWSTTSPNLFAYDAYHASSHGDLATAFALYATMHSDPHVEVIVASGRLSGALAAIGVSMVEALAIARAADLVYADPPVALPIRSHYGGVLIDLSQAAGSPSTPETSPVPGRHYNLIANFTNGVLRNAVDVDGRPTGIEVAVVDGFAGETSGGASGSWIGAVGLSGSLYAESAQLDSFFVGNGFGYSDPLARLRVRGLDRARVYRFVFHGSRDSTAAPRIGRYRIGGREARLDAAHNLNLRAVLTGVRPDASGTVEIEIRPDDGDLGFAYLNVLEVHATGPRILPL